ncbi:MAG: N-acetyl-D-myo-inositol-2-amino-2-deoxy-alpha-D-glucopyranoside deacetylase [Microbacteriaceae bacterium]|nr:N-acetyl-D-myo-inositol-2-amino-2-deoxy-alpha-D-glucopyranoside deacetylase [Microbacteriaceae bacterium]
MQSTNERVLFVHAHPDDESITTGGTIATLIDRGASVTVVTCTRGELGEVIPADLKHLEGKGDLLALQRTAELERAMAALGVTDHRFLGAANARWPELAPRRYTDSGMVWGATGPEPLDSLTDDSFCAAEFGEVAADLAAVIDLVRPNVVISYDENGGYGHPDHIRAHQAARRAAAVMAVPFFVVDEDPVASALTVDVGPVLSRKREALRAYRTQVVVEGNRFALSSGPSRPIAAAEGFSRRLEVEPGALPWKDQGFGVHIMSYLLAFVVGAVIGGISVVNHQFSPQIGGHAIPVGIIVVLLIVAALLAGLRMVFPGRLVVGCAALGLLGVIALLSVASDGGSVLVPANTAGYLLTYGPLVLTVIALAWPAAGTFSRDRLVSKL